MPDFILAFRGGMPKTAEQGQQMMADWTAWMEALGSALVDKGAGLGKSRCLISREKEAACENPLSGYSVISAPNIEVAMEIASKNPIFDLGGTIEVAETMGM